MTKEEKKTNKELLVGSGRQIAFRVRIDLDPLLERVCQLSRRKPGNVVNECLEVRLPVLAKQYEEFAKIKEKIAA